MRPVILGVAFLVATAGCVPPVVFADGPSEIRVAPGEELVLDGAGSFDPVGGELRYKWRQTAGPAVSICDASTPWPRFVPVAPGRYEFELVVSTGAAGTERIESPPARISVMVLPPNRPPLIDVERTLEAEPGQWVVLDAGRTSDPDGDIVAFEWRKVRGEYALMEPKDGRGRRVRVRAWKRGEYLFRLTATDAYGAAAAAEVVLRVAPRRVPPVAVPAQKAPGGEVSVPVRLTAWPHPSGGVNRRPVAAASASGPDTDGLVVVDGNASSDPDGDELAYAWRQVSGPMVRTLFGAGADDRAMARIEFDPPSGGAYTFELLVSDGSLRSEPVRVTVEVDEPKRDVPRVEDRWRTSYPRDVGVVSTGGVGADAGRDQVVEVNEEVTLDGSRSSLPGGGTPRYAWRQTAGPRVREFRLSDLGDEGRPRFVPSEPGRYEFALRVSPDGLAWSDPSFVNVYALAPNRPPTVVIPEKLRARPGQTVIVAAATGDPDGDAVRVRWRRAAGPRARLATNGDRVGFIAPDSGRIVLVAECDDGRGARTRRATTITVVPDGVPPVASACVGGRGRARCGERVVLDGSGSYDPLGAPLEYAWGVEGQALVELSGAKRAVAAFVPSTGGQYVFTLTVTAAGRESAPARLIVDVGDARRAPDLLLLRTVPSVVTVGNPVVLDASQSRREEAVLPVRWRQTEGEALALPDAPAARVVVTPRAAGAYVVEASCGAGAARAALRFAAVEENRPPDVRARAKKRGPNGVVLDGSGTRDAEGAPLSYRWVQTGGPSLRLPAESSAATRLALEEVAPGAYGVRLIASDGERVARSGEVRFTVREWRARGE